VTALLSCLVLLAALIGDGHAADCPHHAPVAAAETTDHDHSHGPAPHAAGHGAHDDGTSAARAPDGGSHGDDACTCLGACQVSAHVLHSAPLDPVLLAQVAGSATAVVFYQDALRGRIPYLIPFGTSPPA